MISSNCLNFNNFHNDFYATLENDCQQERDQFCQDKPGLIQKNGNKWYFENLNMTTRVNQALERIRFSLEAAKAKGLVEGAVSLHYCLGEVDTKGELNRNIVYIAPLSNKLLTVQDAIDGELFDKVILPCFKKMCKKQGIHCQLAIGQKGVLDVSTLKQESFAILKLVKETLATTKVEMKMNLDGFEAVKSSKKPQKNSDSAIIWNRQHASK